MGVFDYVTKDEETSERVQEENLQIPQPNNDTSGYRYRGD